MHRSFKLLLREALATHRQHELPAQRLRLREREKPLLTHGCEARQEAEIERRMRTAAAGISSIKRMSARIFARLTGSGGAKLSGLGTTSSRYSIITDESITIAPLWSSVGTTPFGFSAK